MTPEKIEIAIADDHPMILSGLPALLAHFTHIEVAGAYPDGPSLLEGLAGRQPDVLLLDVVLPGISGKELAPLISELYPMVRILVLTSLDSPALVGNMLRKGCKGFLLKGAGAPMLKEAIETVYGGGEFIDPALRELLIQQVLRLRGDHSRQELLPELTQREKEILQLIAAEYTTREIAEKLFISYRTAENHRYNLLQKLEVKNTAGLVKVAIQLGLDDGIR